MQLLLNRILRILSRGYNWIDFAFLVGLTLVAFSLAVPSLHRIYRDYSLFRAAEEIAECLEWARELANSEGQTFQVQLNESEAGLHIINMSSPGSSSAGEVRLGDGILIRAWANFPVEFSKGGVYEGASIWLARQSGQTIEVRVDRLGNVSVNEMRVYPFEQ